MKQQDEILHIEPKKTIYNLDDESEITESFNENKTELQYEFSSDEIDFKNTDFNSEDIGQEINDSIITTNDDIKNIDVEFESVESINEFFDEKIDVVDDESVNIDNELQFDFPVTTSSNSQEKVVHILEEDVNEIEVIDPVHIIPYTLVEDDNLSVGTVESNHNELKKTEVNPINSPIVDGLAKRTEERKIKLKEFNYKFVKTRKVEDMEKEPAYKRAGIELSDNIENIMSSSTLDQDEDGNLNLKSKNSFLHDNVD
jgi:cell division protein FtsZ